MSIVRRRVDNFSSLEEAPARRSSRNRKRPSKGRGRHSNRGPRKLNLKVEYSEDADKYLDSIPLDEKERILSVGLKIGENPNSSDYDHFPKEKLVGDLKKFYIRRAKCDNYRIIFRIKKKFLEVIKIGFKRYPTDNKVYENILKSYTPYLEPESKDQ